MPLIVNQIFGLISNTFSCTLSNNNVWEYPVTVTWYNVVYYLLCVRLLNGGEGNVIRMLVFVLYTTHTHTYTYKVVNVELYLWLQNYTSTKHMCCVVLCMKLVPTFFPNMCITWLEMRIILLPHTILCRFYATMYVCSTYGWFRIVIHARFSISFSLNVRRKTSYTYARVFPSPKTHTHRGRKSITFCGEYTENLFLIEF